MPRGGLEALDVERWCWWCGVWLYRSCGVVLLVEGGGGGGGGGGGVCEASTKRRASSLVTALPS